MEFQFQSGNKARQSFRPVSINKPINQSINQASKHANRIELTQTEPRAMTREHLWYRPWEAGQRADQPRGLRPTCLNQPWKGGPLHVEGAWWSSQTSVVGRMMPDALSLLIPGYVSYLGLGNQRWRQTENDSPVLHTGWVSWVSSVALE